MALIETTPVAGAETLNLSCLLANLSSCSDFLSVVDVAAPKRSALFFKTSMDVLEATVGLVSEGFVLSDVINPNRAALSAFLLSRTTAGMEPLEVVDDTVEFPNFFALNSSRSWGVNSEILMTFFSGSPDKSLSELSFCSGFVNSTC